MATTSTFLRSAIHYYGVHMEKQPLKMLRQESTIVDGNLSWNLDDVGVGLVTLFHSTESSASGKCPFNVLL